MFFFCHRFEILCEKQQSATWMRCEIWIPTKLIDKLFNEIDYFQSIFQTFYDSIVCNVSLWMGEFKPDLYVIYDRIFINFKIFKYS